MPIVFVAGAASREHEQTRSEEESAAAIAAANGRTFVVMGVCRVGCGTETRAILPDTQTGGKKNRRKNRKPRGDRGPRPARGAAGRGRDVC